MFLCDECHKKSGCSHGFIEGYFLSSGRCENCDETTNPNTSAALRLIHNRLQETYEETAP